MSIIGSCFWGLKMTQKFSDFMVYVDESGDHSLQKFYCEGGRKKVGKDFDQKGLKHFA